MAPPNSSMNRLRVRGQSGRAARTGLALAGLAAIWQARAARRRSGLGQQGIQISNDQSVRRALGPLNQIAARQGCVFLLVRTSEQVEQRAGPLSRRRLDRLSGRLPFDLAAGAGPQGARAACVAQVKNNLARLQKSLALTVASLTPAELEDRADAALARAQPLERRPTPRRGPRSWLPRHRNRPGLPVSEEVGGRRSPENACHLASRPGRRLFRADVASSQKPVVR